MDAVHAPFVVFDHLLEVGDLFHLLHQLRVQSREYHLYVIVSNPFRVLGQLLE